MAMWVFGYGSLIWKAGFRYDDRLVGFIKDYRRVFYQGSTDHRGSPEFPGRTVTLEPAKGEVCWGVAYKIIHKEDQETALEHLEVREKQYDKKAYVNFYIESSVSTPAVSSVMVYIASADKKLNKNYLGPASVEEIAVFAWANPSNLCVTKHVALTCQDYMEMKMQILKAEGPSGPNRDYLFKLENALIQIGCEDNHVNDLSNEVRRMLFLQGDFSD